MKQLNTARGEDAVHLHHVAAAGGSPGPVQPPRDAEFLHRTAPSRQRQAKAFLDGKSPGIMQSYAPGAKVSDVEGWVEDDETVHRLAHWRAEAIY